MSRLLTEWHRLYALDAPVPPTAGLEPWLATTPASLSPDGRTRLLVLELARPADWDRLGAVWQGVQADLELPAPAIAVNGVDGYQLWFSLAEAVDTAQAQAFLQGLLARYLDGMQPQRLRCWPAQATCQAPQMQVPAEWPNSGHWSAFVAPDLARIFADDPWLDISPSPVSQAEVLAGLKTTPMDLFEAALAALAPRTIHAERGQHEAGSAASMIAQAPANGGSGQHAGAPPNFACAAQDPQGFLHAVMNDERVALVLRIEAAKALLPFAR